MPPHTPREPEHWHLDRKVPLAIIVAIFMQTAGALWFASKLESRVERLEQNEAGQRVRDQQQDHNSREASSSLAGRLERIDAKLDRLIEGRFGRAEP